MSEACSLLMELSEENRGDGANVGLSIPLLQKREPSVGGWG